MEEGSEGEETNMLNLNQSRVSPAYFTLGSRGWRERVLVGSTSVIIHNNKHTSLITPLTHHTGFERDQYDRSSVCLLGVTKYN